MHLKHPLLRLIKTQSEPPAQDMTQDDFTLKKNFLRKIKINLGKIIYPIKNFIEYRFVISKVLRLNVTESQIRTPQLLTLGDRGFGRDILLNKISKIVGGIEIVACFGCGSGLELLDLAKYLKPKKIIAYDFFNYALGWEAITKSLTNAGIEVIFIQHDIRLPLLVEEKADLLISFEVLEHLSDISQILGNVKKILKEDGYFASTWGPLWYVYSGDHIAGELGFSHGYDHLLLGSTEYEEWYRNHPRNKEWISKGGVTWLELGLISYAKYQEYIDIIETLFGTTIWQAWCISPKALKWHGLHPELWEKILTANREIEPIDLILQSVAIVSRPNINPGGVSV